MHVGDEQIAAVSAYLKGDAPKFERLGAEARRADETIFSALFAAAFLELVRRHFGVRCRLSEIVEFVGTVRVRAQRRGDDVDPLVAENLLRSALGEERDLERFDERDKADTQLVLMSELVTLEDLDDAGLEELLERARVRAERFLVD